MALESCKGVFSCSAHHMTIKKIPLPDRNDNKTWTNSLQKSCPPNTAQPHTNGKKLSKLN